MNDYWVYVLKCSDDSFYTGRTTDLEIRLAQHQSGFGSKHTRNRLPVTLVFSQQLPDSGSAFQAEQQIKGWSRAKKEALIEENWDLLKWLSKKPEFRAKQSAKPTTD